MNGPNPETQASLVSSGRPGDDHAVASLSVVIPAYNEVGRLGRTLAAIRAYVEETHDLWEVIVVDDGSTDGTAALAQRFDPGPLRLVVLSHPKNLGKGFSVRNGMLAASGAVMLMCDADLSTPIEEVERLLPWIARGCDVVIGSRHLPDSLVDPPQPFVRRVMDEVFRRIRQVAMLKDLEDTQCGFKCFTRSAARHAFPLLTVPGFGFDCEVLWLARRLNYRIKEVAVRWGDDRDSRVRPVRDSCTMLHDLLVIRHRHGKTDDPAPGATA